MSFWFQPTRTDSHKEDLHSTDVQFLHEMLRYNGTTFGNKGIADTFCDILPGFTELINKWACPQQVEEWGKFLLKLCKHMHEYHSEEEFCLISFYGDLFIKLGQRGIGLYLSW